MSRTHAAYPDRRITVNLPARAASAVETIMATLGIDQTQAVARALQLLARAVEADAEGGGLFMKDGPTAEIQRVILL